MGGIFGFSGIEDKHLLKKMSSTLTHRALDGFHYHICNKAAFGQGITKIGTDYCPKPIVNEEGTVVLLMDGRLFNSKELKDTLKQRHEFSTTFSGEVILHLYEEQGMGFVPALEGDFGFCLYDSKKKELILCADSAGTKPIYYYQNKGAVIFGSDIKPILEFGFEKQLEKKAVDLLLTYLVISNDLTLVKNVKRVMPGTCVQFVNNKKNIVTHFTIQEQISRSKPKTYFIKNTRKLLEEAVEKRVIDQVPVHASLGGLDSGTIVALLSRYTDTRNLNVYTLGTGSEHDEFSFCKEFAQGLGVKWYTILMNEKHVDYFYNSVLPFFNGVSVMDVGALAGSVILSHTKARGLYFNGEGADPVFGGPKNEQMILDYHMQKLPFLAKKAISYGILSVNAGILLLNSLVFKEQSIEFRKNVCFYPKSIEEKYANLTNTLFFDLHHNRDILNLYRRYLGDHRYHFLNRLMKLNIELKSYMDHLPRNEILATRVGCLNNIPFLDKKIIEFSFTVPIQYKFKKYSNKILLANATKDIFSKRVPKRGFVEPIKDLLHGYFEQRKDAIQRLINSSEVLRDLDKNFIGKLFHTSSKLDRSQKWKKTIHIHTLYSLGLWYAHYFDNEKIEQLI